jgi:hypothetical protein
MPHVRVLPIRTGKTDACKRFIHELVEERREQFADTQRAEGITEEHFFIQSDQFGDYLIVYNDGDKIAREHMRQVRARSDDPFDIWFREQFQDVHGINLARPPEGGARIEHLASWEDRSR